MNNSNLDAAWSSFIGLWACAMIFYVVIVVLLIWVYWKILQKAGYNGAWALLTLVPFGSLGIMLFLAFSQWPVSRGPVRTAVAAPPPVRYPTSPPLAASGYPPPGYAPQGYAPPQAPAAVPAPVPMPMAPPVAQPAPAPAPAPMPAPPVAEAPAPADVPEPMAPPAAEPPVPEPPAPADPPPPADPSA
jgi:hypothetical protein